MKALERVFVVGLLAVGLVVSFPAYRATAAQEVGQTLLTLLTDTDGDGVYDTKTLLACVDHLIVEEEVLRGSVGFTPYIDQSCDVFF